MTKTTTDPTGLHTVPLASVLAWPDLNPRISFDQAALDELAASIADVGLLQPVSVAPAGLKKGGVRFWLFAGERRLRAVKLAGLKTIDVIVHDIDEATAHRLAGIENIERNDLTAIEEAIWLARELELTGKSQRELGEDLGRSQAWIANRIRLLDLPKGLRGLIHDGTIAPAMARDHLLRFLSLAKTVRILTPITKGLRKAAEKNGGTVERAVIEEVIYHALQDHAVEIREGHVQIPGRGDYRSVRVSPASMKAFRAGLGEGMVVQAMTGRRGGEETYTFDAKAWKAHLDAEYKAEEKRRAKVKEGPSYEAKIGRAKLGLDKKPRKLRDLEDTFGLSNVQALADLGDLEGIEPSQVIPGLVDRGAWKGNQWTPEVRTELVYVGTDAGKREEAKRTAQGKEVRKSEERATKKALTAASGTTAPDGLRGLVDVLLTTYDLASVVVKFLRAMGRDVPNGWTMSPYAGSLDQIEPALTSQELRTLCGALTATLAVKEDAYAARQRRSAAATEKVSKQRAKALEAWLAEHVAPKVSK